MTTDFQRILIALVIMLGIAVPLHRVLAFDLIDINTQQSIDCTFSNNPQQCLDQCHNIRIGNILSALQTGYLKQLAANIAHEIAQQALQFAAKVAICSVIPDKTVSVGLFGTGYNLTFKGPHCDFTSDFATSSILSTIKQQAVDNVKNTFIARCASDGMRKQLEDNIHNMIQQNGPDGGQAFVSDWVSLPANEDRRGVNRFWAILANTPICSYFRDRVYAHYGVPQDYIDHPPAIGKDGLAVNAGDPLTVRGACTLPDGLTPQSLDANFIANGGIVALALLNQPQNNYDGFINMADGEEYAQEAATVNGAENEAIAGGGFRGLYSSCIDDGFGHCLDQSVTQPAGGVQAAQAAIYTGNFNLIANNSTIGPVGARLASMILNVNNDPLNYDPQLDQNSQNYVNIGNGTVQPSIIDAPTTPPDAATLACTDNNPQCSCVTNNTDYLELGQQLVPAEQAVLALPVIGQSLSSDGVHINAGREMDFLSAVCNSDVGKALNCFPKPGSTTDILLDAQAVTISFNLIGPNGLIRMPGQAIAVCPAGAQ